MIGLLSALMLGAALAMDPGVGVEPMDPPPPAEEVEALAYEIADGLRCPVCQGLSVAASSSDAAVAMKGRIQELVAQGYTRGQIEDYFTERYGTWVLLEPEAEGLNLLVWLAPLTLLGGGLLWWVARSRADAAAPVAGASAAPSPEADTNDEAAPLDDYAQRILDELDG